LKLPKMSFPDPPSASGSSPPRSFWNSVLTMTPVLLTVFATVLAGLSSSEMTLAQYHRAMAAQHQSKAGDQWSLFQAKKIRGMEAQRTIHLLQALSEPGKMDAPSLEMQAGEFLRDLRRIEDQTGRLLGSIGSAKAVLGPGAASLVETADDLKKSLGAKVKNAEAANEKLKHALAQSQMRAALQYSAPDDSSAQKTHVQQDPTIEQAVSALRSHHPDSEVASLALNVPDSVLTDALRQANDSIAAVEEAGKPIARSLDQIDQLFQELVTIPRPIIRSAEQLQRTVNEIPKNESKAVTAVRDSAAALVGSIQALRSSANQSRQDFVVAEDSYAARRYDREARANQDTAELYELQVRKSDLKSERHRDRSKLFFYGMLAAQAGVMIASFALAVKHRSVLWSLAASAGLGAVLFGAYVYWYM